MSEGSMVPETANGQGPQAAGLVRREEFGATEMQRAGETSAAAVAEQARALVEARFIVAMKRPRDLDMVRTKILKEVKRPTMARSAIYRKPVGEGFVEGPSVRFAEMALRNMANLAMDTVTVYDDPQRRILRVGVTDCETNITFSVDVTVEKTVERKNATGRVVLSSRPNSEGKTTYLVVATDDELLTKQNALLSKALRNSALRVVPGDITEEAMKEARAVRKDEDARDPDAARKQLVDAFAGINVMPDQIKAYLGHDLGMVSPVQLDDLRGIYTAIRDGETTWAAVIAKTKDAPAATDPKGAAATSSGDLKARVAAKAAEKRAKPDAKVDADGVVADEPKGAQGV